MQKPKSVAIGGHRFRIVEDLGFHPKAKCYVKIVQLGYCQKPVVKFPSEREWRFWTEKDVQIMGYRE